MRAQLLLANCVFLAITSCRENASTPPRLTPGSLYNIDSVRAVLPSASSSDKWDKKLTQAEALYKVKQRYSLAATALKEIIYQAPSPKAYYDLGTALLLDKQYPEAIQALRVAEDLHYQPLYNVMYRLAAAYIDRVHGADSLSAHYMQLALQMGYPDPEKFKKDPAFAHIDANFYLIDAFNDGMQGRTQRTASDWKDYLTGFAQASFPLTIDTLWLKSHPASKLETISFQYERYVTEMKDAEFSRESEPGYFYVGRIKADTAFTAVVYGGSDSWDEYTSDEITDSTQFEDNVFFYLATYTSEGKIIDKMLVAQTPDSFHPFANFMMATPQNFLVRDGSGTKYFHINAVGKFEPMDPAGLAFR